MNSQNGSAVIRRLPPVYQIDLLSSDHHRYRAEIRQFSYHEKGEENGIFSGAIIPERFRNLVGSYDFSVAHAEHGYRDDGGAALRATLSSVAGYCRSHGLRPTRLWFADRPLCRDGARHLLRQLSSDSGRIASLDSLPCGYSVHQRGRGIAVDIPSGEPPAPDQ